MKITEIVDADEFQKQELQDVSRETEITHLTKMANQVRHRLQTARDRLMVHRTKPAVPGRARIEPENLMNVKISELGSTLNAITQKIRELTIAGNSFCFTGFRDAKMENTIKALGGRIVSSVSSRLDFLVALDPDEKSGKLQKAKEFGTIVLSKARMIQILRGDYIPTK